MDKSIMETTNLPNYACAVAITFVFLFIIHVRNYILCRNDLGFPGTVEEIQTKVAAHEKTLTEANGDNVI